MIVRDNSGRDTPVCRVSPPADVANDLQQLTDGGEPTPRLALAKREWRNQAAAQDLGFCAFGRGGSSPPSRTNRPYEVGGTMSRIAGASARNALPRCEIAFFSPGDISAVVRVSPSGTKTGS